MEKVPKISQHVQCIDFESFSLTVVSDYEYAYFCYHIVMKPHAMPFLDLFESILKNTSNDFFKSPVLYHASIIGPEHFVLSSHTSGEKLNGHNNMTFCHVFPNAVNSRFLDSIEKGGA